MNVENSGQKPADEGVFSTERFREDVSQVIRSRITDLSVDEVEAVKSLPSGAALLVVRRGPDLGARFLLDEDSTIAGRHPEVNIFLDDVTVSRKHAEFIRRGTQFSVRDKGSLNGTFVSGKRIDGEVPLEEGVEVQVGKFKFTFFPSRFDLQNETY